MDIDRYRKQYESELAKASASKAGQRAAKRTAAAKSAKAGATARATALKAAPFEEESLASRVPELLTTLRDRKEATSVRTAALQVLGALDFLGPRFSAHRADYKQALRDIATDPRATLRESAIELLAMSKDPYAQDLLVQGLERPDDAVVSEARALQFLGYDDHADHAPLARRVFKRATGPAREEALRILATDPKSERLFSQLFKDKSEKSNIRRISASGLQSLNPQAFERAARRIVADDGDYNEIRATTLAALAHGREARDKPADPKFVETVQKLTDSTRSTALRASSQRFLRSTET